MFVLFLIIFGILLFQALGFLVYFFGRKQNLSHLMNFTVLTPPAGFAVVVITLTIYSYLTGIDSAPIYALYFGGIILIVGVIINAMCAVIMYFGLRDIFNDSAD